MKCYKIKKVGEPFDGLIVNGDEENMIHNLDEEEENLISISRIHMKHTLFDSYSLPIEDGCLYVTAKNLVEYEEVDSEQLTDNPFGKFVYDGRLNKGSIQLVWVLYEKSLNVKVRNGSNAIYSHNFMDYEKLMSAKDFLRYIQTNALYDWDNLVFDLARYE